MKLFLIFAAAFCLAVAPCRARAQTSRRPVEIEPPPLEKILAGAGSNDDVLASLLATQPEIPLGPPDLLKEYEQAMALVTQNLSADIATVLQAQQANQITREQAEYLIEERYQVAIMQHQVLSALHDALERDMVQEAAPAKRLGQVGNSDALIVGELPSSGLSAGSK